MARVFISHKSEDSNVATWIYAKLRYRGVDAYVDKLDPHINTNKGEDLGEYFRRQLQQCTHLMAVISETTLLSWWVPFEIGIATEREYPLCTFADQGDNYRRYASLYGKKYDIPEYLRKWPYLQTEADMDNYIIALETTPMVRRFAENLDERNLYTKVFYTTLRRYLGQR